MDARSRRIVGYALGRRIEARLTLAALTTAIQSRKPPPGCIHHSDRGSQYAAKAYRTLLSKHDLVGSMARRGNPYDNAMMESFWHREPGSGLGRHVRPKNFHSVLEGFVPGTDLRLRRVRDGGHQHRPGVDLTLSAPKSVSLAALVRGNRRVIRAHDQAVRATLDHVEAEWLQTRGCDPQTGRRPRSVYHSVLFR